MHSESETENVLPAQCGTTPVASNSDMASILAEIDATLALSSVAEAGGLSSPRAATTTRTTPGGGEFRSRLAWFVGVSDVTSRDPGSLTYEPYFGLREKPFSLSSDPRFFFSDSSHGAAFDTLAAGIRRREGILVLTGEVGTGKTTVCRAVLQSLDQRTFAAFVPDPFLCREDLLKTLLIDFGVASVEDVRSGRLRGASRTDLSYPLYEFLSSLQALRAFAVVVIDEAQNLTAELLEEIRILTDLDNGQKLLQVLLVGQPELTARLATPGMRQLSQRVSIRCELAALARQEIGSYMARRLTIAGCHGRVPFNEAAIESVSAATGGIPRVINLVCDRALARAAQLQATTVGVEHVAWAVDGLKWLDVAAPQGAFPSRPEVDAGPESAPPDLVSDGVPLPPARILDDVPDVVVSARPHRSGRLLLVAASVTLVIASIGFWRPTSLTRSALPQPVPPRTVDAAPVAAASGSRVTQSAPRDAVGSTAPATKTPVPGQRADAYALQMATFQNRARAAQALKEFRDAGYRAYDVEVSLPGGERAFAVLLGLYADIETATQDLVRARQIPGYGSGRIIQADRSAPPVISQP